MLWKKNFTFSKPFRKYLPILIIVVTIGKILPSLCMFDHTKMNSNIMNKKSKSYGDKNLRKNRRQDSENRLQSGTSTATGTAYRDTCEEFSHCFSCTQRSECRFCLMKSVETSQLLTRNVSSSSDDAGLQGKCIDLQTTTWDKPILVNKNPPSYAYCGLILPDYLNGITCVDVEAGYNFKPYRDTLEMIKPLLNMPSLDNGQQGGQRDITLEKALQINGGSSTKSSPLTVLFIVGGALGIASFLCGSTLCLIGSCCRTALLCCCCCCSKEAQAVRITNSHSSTRQPILCLANG